MSNCGYLANGRYLCKDITIDAETYIYREIIPLREKKDDYKHPSQGLKMHECTTMIGEYCNPLQANPCCKGACEPVFDETTNTFLHTMYACTESNMRSFESKPRPFYACQIP